MKFYRKFCFAVAVLWLMSPMISVNASPPACDRNEVSLFIAANAVVEAEVINSRRWSEGGTLLHLVAKYMVADVFKGEVDKDEILIVTDTCLDKPIPRYGEGYPVVEEYCRGGIGLHLTGVNSRDGKPVMTPGAKPSWILFLRKDIRKGAPQQTWIEVSETSFHGGCRQTRDDIPPDQREGFDRLRQRENRLGAKRN